MHSGWCAPVWSRRRGEGGGAFPMSASAHGPSASPAHRPPSLAPQRPVTGTQPVLVSRSCTASGRGYRPGGVVIPDARLRSRPKCIAGQPLIPMAGHRLLSIRSDGGLPPTQGWHARSPSAGVLARGRRCGGRGLRPGGRIARNLRLLT